MSHPTDTAAEVPALDRCVSLIRKWGPPLALIALGFAIGWL